MFIEWHRVRNTNTFVNLSLPGWRVRLIRSAVIVERRRPKLTKGQRYSGAWQRAGKFNKPRNVKECRKLEGWISKLISLNRLDRNDAWDGTQDNRRRPDIGRGRKVKKIPGRMTSFGWAPATGRRLGTLK